MWICKTCNKEIEDDFDSCWNCAGNRLVENLDRLREKLEPIRYNDLWEDTRRRMAAEIPS